MKMNILLAFNSNYFIGAMALLQSILDNNDWCEEIHCYVFYSQLTEEERKRFEEAAKKFKRAYVHYYKVAHDTYAEAPIHLPWISKETYYRLLAQELLPESVERILYLDADMIVMKPLKQLYETDFDGKLMVACNRRKQGEIDAHRLEMLTLPPDTIYFNAGMLLYNLREQRKQINPAIYQEYLQLFSKWLTYQDQDVLNAVFYGLTKYVDYRYYNVLDCDITNEEKRERALKRTVIFHYNGMGKPWTRKYWGRMADIFWKYAEELPEYKDKYQKLKIEHQKYKKIHAQKQAEATRMKHKRETLLKK